MAKDDEIIISHRRIAKPKKAKKAKKKAAKKK
jgi:hypothetical protein